MRIQHNILAMNAYRNYNTNTSALAKNLEKLSSGYKINRAGDDAAGLAISEKMRAQITGLNAAQKNVKDGISLVKTAEGAMQEIQDMLNRMDYLATQSANGTYDNEVDRAALQKEVEQLKSEINRIADSANFNGINLLDGSLDINNKGVAGGTTSTDKVVTADLVAGKDLPGVGQTLGVDTVLHQEVQTSKSGSEFTLNLHNVEFNNQKGDILTITIGEGDKATTISLKSLKDHTQSSSDSTKKTLKESDLVNALMGKAPAGGDPAVTAANFTEHYEVKINGRVYTAGDKVSINGQDFSLENVTNNGMPGIKFKQDAPPVDASEEINPSMKVTIKGDIAATEAKYLVTGLDNGATKIDGGSAASIVLSIGNEEFKFKSTATLQDMVDEINDNCAKYKAEKDTSGKLLLTAREAGADEKPEISWRYDLDDPAAGKATTTLSQKAAEDGKKATAGGTALTDATLKGIDLSTDQIEIDGNKLEVGTGKFTTSKGITYEYELNAAGTITITAVDKGKDANGVLTFTATSTNATTGEKTIKTTNVTVKEGKDVVKSKTTYDVSTWSSGQLKVGDKTFDYGASIENEQVSISGVTFNATLTGSTLTLERADDPAEASTASSAANFAPQGKDVKIANVNYLSYKTTKKGADAVDGRELVDYNKSTTDQLYARADAQKRIASTWFNLTKDMILEGSKLRIGTETYLFTADKDKLATNNRAIDISSGDLTTIAQKLTDAAFNNATWTVGHDGNRITLTEAKANDDKYAVNEGTGAVTFKGTYDLRTEEGIAKSLGFQGVSKTTSSSTAAVEGGKPLQLQIGDTSEEYNQLQVSVGDMHTTAMGVADLSIATAEDAAGAIDVIKNAINYVSSVRGDLGATQNRLEHTANNLSVMAENIQDAESTIRDTDVAEEMMAYTKNNILIQSAQAMLAQANAIPQGVLQLLG